MRQTKLYILIKYPKNVANEFRKRHSVGSIFNIKFDTDPTEYPSNITLLTEDGPWFLSEKALHKYFKEVI